MSHIEDAMTPALKLKLKLKVYTVEVKVWAKASASKESVEEEFMERLDAVRYATMESSPKIINDTTCVSVKESSS